MGCGASRSIVVLGQDSSSTGAPMLLSISSQNIGWLDVGLSCSPACREKGNGAVDRNNDSKHVKTTNKDRRRNGCPEILTVKELQAFAFDLGFGTRDLDSVTKANVAAAPKLKERSLSKLDRMKGGQVCHSRGV